MEVNGPNWPLELSNPGCAVRVPSHPEDPSVFGGFLVRGARVFPLFHPEVKLAF